MKKLFENSKEHSFTICIALLATFLLLPLGVEAYKHNEKWQVDVTDQCGLVRHFKDARVKEMNETIKISTDKETILTGAENVYIWKDK